MIEFLQLIIFFFLFQVPLPFPINVTPSSMIYSPHLPPQLPPNGANNNLQTTQSANHMVPSSNSVNSMHPNQNNIHHHSGGPSLQIQHCNFGARPQPHQFNGANGTRPTAVPTNGCYPNAPGVIPTAIAPQPHPVHQIAGPPPPYHFQHAPNNALQGQTAYVGPPQSCNLQGVPTPVPFSAAGTKRMIF